MNDINTIVDRSAPRWAWDIIDQLLRAYSDHDFAVLASKAIIVACEHPELESLTRNQAKGYDND